MPEGVRQQGSCAACPDDADAAHFCLAGAIRQVSCDLVHGQPDTVTETRRYDFRIPRGTLDSKPETLS